MNEPDNSSLQEARAIIRDGRITLTRRPLFLGRERTKSAADELRTAGTVICDVEITPGAIGERELSVSQPIGSDFDDQAIEALAEWAAMLGCCRIWLPDSLIEISDDLLPDPADLEADPCPTCGVAPDRETAADLIASRRRRGQSWTRCPVCMNSVPERARRRSSSYARSNA